MKRYNPAEIEPKWQKSWDESGIYTANLTSDKPKYIAMSMFNYPSGAGIHIGHAMNYTIPDVKARFKRQQGYESFHPVGWDSFGLPAENYAIKAGVSPQASMATIIPAYHKQYKAMGWSNDWTKEIVTSEPEYYRWTQWIFTQMLEKGLAYQASRMQWWCDIDKTVLANEQVIDGKCWRHDGPDDPLVEKREIKQWFFKITEYADELLEAIDGLDWSDSVKLAQKNWIGKSMGAEVDFAVDGSDQKITVFTTRPDTLFGATFLVVAPESELLEHIVTPDNKAAVDKYVSDSTKKTELERQASKEKSGVFTGAYATNPINNEKIPVWVADYVLEGYGTGAIMAVPAHDERDNEFAKKFDIAVTQVVAPMLLDQENPPQEGKEDTDRNVVMCLIEHPSDGTYLTIRWNKYDWHNFVMGGVEGDESVESAARREIQEETGYTDLETLGTLPLIMNSKFYALHKNVNRNILTTVLSFKLKSLNQVALNRLPHEDFELEWTSHEKLQTLRPLAELPYILRWMKGDDVMFSGDGVLINSGNYNGVSSAEAREQIVAHLERGEGKGKVTTNYRMRDWSVSRQRYWGAPIPIINCPKCGAVSVPDEDLPVVLPLLDDFEPTGDGRSALARATEWLKVDCPTCGGMAERETDTLDTYLDSAWYMYRYFDPHNAAKIFDSDIVKKWEPIDFYNGADHATAHLLYARFIARFFTKIGLVNEPEPFKEFLFNGKVTAADGKMFSKSKGNGVDPLEIINQGYGADALRMYLMFAAPLDIWAKWDSQGVPGTHRFLTRLWNLVQEYLEADEVETVDTRALEAIRSRMIKKVTEDIEANRYNTAIAAIMTSLNELSKEKGKMFGKNEAWQSVLESVIACVAPFAPHIADELWQQLGHDTSVHVNSWPTWDEAALESDTMTIVVQVNGKVRGELTLSKDTSKEDIEAKALTLDKVQKQLTGKTPTRVIYIPGRVVNIVIT